MIQRYGLIDIYGGIIENDLYNKYTVKLTSGAYVLYADHLADHEAAMKEKDREIATIQGILDITNATIKALSLGDLLKLQSDTTDLLKKLERANDAWIKAKGEIETLNKQHEVGFSDIILAKNAELAGLRTKLAAAEKERCERPDEHIFGNKLREAIRLYNRIRSKEADHG